jgi:hypothetical protein
MTMPYKQQLALLKAKLPPNEERLHAMTTALKIVTDALHIDLASIPLDVEVAYDLVHAKFLEATSEGEHDKVIPATSIHVYKSGPSPKSIKLGEMTTIGLAPDWFEIRVVWESAKLGFTSTKLSPRHIATLRSKSGMRTSSASAGPPRGPHQSFHFGKLELDPRSVSSGANSEGQSKD